MSDLSSPSQTPGSVPDKRVCVGLLKGAGCSSGVVAHCLTVAGVATEMAVSSGIADLRLVCAGALLHDIGRGLTHSLSHAQAGAAYCRRSGIAEEVARIVECHTGAGLTADECVLLGLLPIDCMPVTLPEKIVAHADNLVRGTQGISIEKRLLKAYSLQRKVRRRMYHLSLEVSQCCDAAFPPRLEIPGVR